MGAVLTPFYEQHRPNQIYTKRSQLKTQYFREIFLDLSNIEVIRKRQTNRKGWAAIDTCSAGTARRAGTDYSLADKDEITTKPWVEQSLDVTEPASQQRYVAKLSQRS
jgi:hypothetical protein